ncbi:hypothetical protein RUND412_001361 [Rhizina undulata]
MSPTLNYVITQHYPNDRLQLVLAPYLEGNATTVLSYRSYGRYLGGVEILAKRFFLWYKVKYIAQIELEESGEYVRTLETALAKMVNVRVITTSHNNIGIPGGFGNWWKLLADKPRTFVDKWSWHEYFILHTSHEGLETKEQALKSVMDLVETTHCLGRKLDVF